jgi:hypothetical protein
MLKSFSILLAAVIVAPLATSRADDESFRAGADSFPYRVAVSRDELRGPVPATEPSKIKEEVRPLLDQLRGDGKGLKSSTERNIETFFTVADAFEADGRLATAADVLHNLKENLGALVAARAGKPRADSLIATEDDLLAYRDAHNVHLVTPGYMAGGQPSEAGFRWLKSKGVTTVINLRESSEFERAMLQRLGLRSVQIAWPDLQPPSVDQARQIVKIVQEEGKKGGKVFQHCLRGIGRDGTMVCCVRIAGGMTAEQAIQQWLKAAPTWLEDQARDPEGKPVQVEAVRRFAREFSGTGD